MVTNELLSKEQVFIFSEEMKMKAVEFDERLKRTLLSEKSQTGLLTEYKNQLLIDGDVTPLLRILRHAEEQVAICTAFYKRQKQ